MVDCTARTAEAHLVLRNELSELERLAAFVGDYAERAGLPSATAFAIELCLDEAIANIVRHGAGPARASRIAVTLRRAGGRIELAIADDGAPFDPTGAPPPRTAASLEEAQIGGLGVHLMRTFSSTMRYERTEGQNRLILSFVASAG